MANNLSNYAENRVLDHLTGRTSFTMPTVYWGLFNTDPGEAGGGTEVKAPGSAGYARQQTTWTVATAGATDNSAAIVWGPASDGTWAVVNFIAAFDASTAGNCLWYGPTTAKTVGSGDSYQIAIGNLDLSID